MPSSALSLRRHALHRHGLALVFVMLASINVYNVQAATLSEAKEAAASGRITEAAAIYQTLAAQGDAKAQFNLGTMYMNGEGVVANKQQALDWYRRSAEAGYVEAQYTLGVLYFRPEMVGTPDYTSAIAWYKKAAEQGHEKSQLNLGIIYFRGDVIEPDYPQSARWYVMAAEQGNAEAQYNLGVMYANAEGIPADLPRGYMWLKMASENQDASARRMQKRLHMLAFVGAKMSAEQKAEGEALALKCKQQQGRGC